MSHWIWERVAFFRLSQVFFFRKILGFCWSTFIPASQGGFRTKKKSFQSEMEVKKLIKYALLAIAETSWRKKKLRKIATRKFLQIFFFCCLTLEFSLGEKKVTVHYIRALILISLISWELSLCARSCAKMSETQKWNHQWYLPPRKIDWK